jgi:hypothetical protein
MSSSGGAYTREQYLQEIREQIIFVENQGSLHILLSRYKFIEGEKPAFLKIMQIVHEALNISEGRAKYSTKSKRDNFLKIVSLILQEIISEKDSENVVEMKGCIDEEGFSNISHLSYPFTKEVCTGDDDIEMKDCTKDFSKITKFKLYVTAQIYGHGGTTHELFIKKGNYNLDLIGLNSPGVCSWTDRNYYTNTVDILRRLPSNFSKKKEIVKDFLNYLDTYNGFANLNYKPTYLTSTVPQSFSFLPSIQSSDCFYDKFYQGSAQSEKSSRAVSEFCFLPRFTIFHFSIYSDDEDEKLLYYSGTSNLSDKKNRENVLLKQMLKQDVRLSELSELINSIVCQGLDWVISNKGNGPLKYLTRENCKIHITIADLLCNWTETESISESGIKIPTKSRAAITCSQGLTALDIEKMNDAEFAIVVEDHVASLSSVSSSAKAEPTTKRGGKKTKKYQISKKVKNRKTKNIKYLKNKKIEKHKNSSN